MFESIATGLATPLLAYVVLPSFPLLYVILRWRAGGGDQPGIGSIAALLYLRSLAILGACSGLSLLLYGLWKPGDGEGTLRFAGGVLAASAVFLVVVFALTQRFGGPPPEHPARRIFSGFLLVVSGLVTFTAFLAVGVEVCSKDPDADTTRLFASFALVWFVAMVLAVLRLGRTGRALGANP